METSVGPIECTVNVGLLYIFANCEQMQYVIL